MDKRKKAYFRREFTRRTAAARWADRIFFTLLAWVIFYGWFLTQLSNTLAAAILASASALTGVTAAALFRSIRFDKFVRRHTETLKKQALLEHLMVLPPNGVMDILLSADPSLSGIHGVAVCENGFVARLPNGKKRMCALLQKYPSEKVSASELLELHRRADSECCLELWVYSTANYSAEAETVAKNGEISAKLNSPEELIAIADRLELLPDERGRIAEERVFARRGPKVYHLRRGDHGGLPHYGIQDLLHPDGGALPGFCRDQLAKRQGKVKGQIQRGRRLSPALARPSPSDDDPGLVLGPSVKHELSPDILDLFRSRALGYVFERFFCGDVCGF